LFLENLVVDSYYGEGDPIVCLTVTNPAQAENGEGIYGTWDIFGASFGNECNLSTKQFNQAEISLYPNPTQDLFSIYNLPQPIENLKIYSLNGRLVKEYKAQNNYSTTGLANGIYFVNLETISGNLTKKLVVNQ